MTQQTALIIMACSTTAHYVLAMVFFVYARHKVRYLSIAWIMAIFAFLSTFMCLLWELPSHLTGILQPAALLGLVSICYLQSIYPLSFVMPGYLQWQRMVKYASPVIALIAIYTISRLFGRQPLVIDDISDLPRHILTADAIIRLATLALSLFYIINIFRLPRRHTKQHVPAYIIGYTLALALSAAYYATICLLPPSLTLSTAYVITFTVLNLYLSLRTLETMALELPKPTITAIDKNPSETDLEQAKRDFNEANQKRFERVEYWMQHNVEEWKQFTFGRDRLCRETGINRHLLLQCVRSQGYNDVHDYISAYRIRELKRMIIEGEAHNLTECQDAGFGTIKTVRNSFQKCEGTSVDDFLARHARK